MEIHGNQYKSVQIHRNPLAITGIIIAAAIARVRVGSSKISQKEFAKHTDAINRLYLHNPDVIFIGDAESDKQAAKFAGTKFLMV